MAVAEAARNAERSRYFWAGVSALLRVHRQAAATGTQLRVVASPALRRVLDLTGADQVLDTYPSLADALAGRHTPSVM